ncbi:MAG: ferritin family protein [Deltaproteobacteria bacterium]|nr:ferritin family protein [Deltaproteobacteria bacterium]MBW1959993.1 ferritin family protein [Deltaproteobacteria bacterium]MBW1995503.1 ferritin family protein [Deltaproteobacteria bacterium]MBW2153612.1 ferritin family protein [Deltaproteobacteria bacterium]
MSYDFNAEEILQMAEQIERNGAKFYRTSAEGIEDPASRKMLLDLAAMEEKHEKTFAAMRAELSEKERVKTTFDPENEASLYLKALADSRVFVEREMPDLASFAQRSEGQKMEEIIRFAIGAEKDSIVFYLGMRDTVSEAMGKKRVDDIIREEMSHIRMLSIELVSLKKRSHI